MNPKGVKFEHKYKNLKQYKKIYTYENMGLFNILAHLTYK